VVEASVGVVGWFVTPALDPPAGQYVRVASDEILARLDAAAALRDLNDAFIEYDRDVEGLRVLEQAASREANAMRLGTPRDRAAMAQAYFDSAQHRRGALRDSPDIALVSGLEDRAVAGRANPTATVVDAQYVDDGVMATVTFGPACEGPPGRVHGGIVCAVFDDVTGMLTVRLDDTAFTGELTVRYLAPVPLGEVLTVTARLDGRERRKRFIYEEMSTSEQVVATCRATCIAPAS
jgi:acyl-coenzyme A thioesterase PaaI-like protein